MECVAVAALSNWAYRRPTRRGPPARTEAASAREGPRPKAGRHHYSPALLYNPDAAPYQAFRVAARRVPERKFARQHPYQLVGVGRSFAQINIIFQLARLTALEPTSPVFLFAQALFSPNPVAPIILRKAPSELGHMNGAGHADEHAPLWAFRIASEHSPRLVESWAKPG